MIQKSSVDVLSEFKKEMNNFRELFQNFLRVKNKVFIDWAKINPPPEEMVVEYSSISSCTPEEAQKLSSKFCILKLNGGLGTTMGCTGPKSVIEVRNDMTFLDLTVLQIEVR